MFENGHFSKRTIQYLSDFLTTYRPKDGEKDYAVFDCDGTLLYGDSQASVFEDQMSYLNYALRPEQFTNLLQKDNPTKWNEKCKDFTFGDFCRYLTEEYAYLYKKGFVSKNPMNWQRYPLWKDDPHFLSFQINMHLLSAFAYKFLGYASSAYAAISLFSGFSESEYLSLVKPAIERHSKIQGIKSKSFKSILNDHEVSANIGLHPIKEMLELTRELERAGIDIYVISASHQKTVEIALEYFNFPRSIKVFGIGNKLDRRRLILPERDTINYPYTIKCGKVQVIQERIAPLYKNKGPIITGGDSDGDVAMLSSFTDTKISLFLNGYNQPESRFIAGASLFQTKHGPKGEGTIFLSEGKEQEKLRLTGEEMGIKDEHKVRFDHPEDLVELENGLSFKEYFSRLKENDKFDDYKDYVGYHGL